ncbi:MAG: glycoside hydrolase family 13 protein [Anaerolineales bacterium]|nr:glycoside hydrolase family 13 protein [Anaerolineales bacterium]MCB8953934.1 glycoside hydrolase family 13 protein [Ardenticatenales bacterium]
MPINEVNYFGLPSSLYPFDIRYDQADRAFCDPRPDGRWRVRLQTEPGFAEVVLVYNDGVARSAPMRLWGQTRRFQFWEVVVQPARARVLYSFALKRADGMIINLGRHGVSNAVESPYVLNMTAMLPMEMPAWMSGAIIYQIFPERFANGDPGSDPPGTVAWDTPPRSHQFHGGDLPGITAHLDHLHALGVDVVYLTPIMPSPSNHKYDTADYYHVDAAFGGDEALRELVAGLHRRGMKIVLDASFNHCHPQFFAFQDLLRRGADSPYRDWFTVREFPIKVRARPHKAPAHWQRSEAEMRAWLARFSQSSGVPVEMVEDDGPVVEANYEAWFGVLTMPKINQSNPETRAYFLDVAAYWLREFDIDGWRMDVAQHVVDDFWRDFRRVVKQVKPDAYLLAEVWGDTSHWLQGDMFDATMNYTFRGLCLDYFAQGGLTTADFVDGVQQMLTMYPWPVTLVNQNLLSSHDTPRFLHLAGEDARRWRLATLFQMTLPGAPGIYYGDEIGMTGGHDPDCRRAFPWEARAQWDEETLAWTRSLIALRKRVAALRTGSWSLVWAGAEAFAFVREQDEERLLVVIVRAEGLAQVVLPLTGAPPLLLWGEGEVMADEGGVRVRGMPAWSGLIAQL